jgi:hypothetical protein
MPPCHANSEFFGGVRLTGQAITELFFVTSLVPSKIKLAFVALNAEN